MAAKTDHAVCSGDRRVLERAAAFLRGHGIASSHGAPKREGLLRVRPNEAARARALLSNEPSLRDHVLTGAAWFNCHACEAELHGGEMHCPSCGAFVRD